MAEDKPTKLKKYVVAEGSVTAKVNGKKVTVEAGGEIQLDDASAAKLLRSGAIVEAGSFRRASAPGSSPANEAAVAAAVDRAERAEAALAAAEAKLVQALALLSPEQKAVIEGGKA